MGDIVWVLLHFGQDVAHNLPVLVLGDIRELGPRKAVVEIIFHLVVLGKAKEVAVLHVHQVVWPSIADVHDGGGRRAVTEENATAKRKEDCVRVLSPGGQSRSAGGAVATRRNDREAEGAVLRCGFRKCAT